MLDDKLKTQLKAYLERVTRPVELVSSLDDRPASQEMRELLDEIGALSDKIAVRHDGDDARRRSFSISRAGTSMGMRFAAIPMGHEFTSLVLALLQAGGHPPKVEADVIEQIQALRADDASDFVFETYMSLSYHNCPDVVQALNLMAILNPRIRHVAIDGGLFQAEVEARQIMAVPMVFLNGKMFHSGRIELADILAKIDTGSAARDAAKLGAKDTFDMLIVGGGRPVPQLRSTPRAKASALAWWPSASVARHSTRWASRTSSRCKKRRARSSPPRWRRRCAATAWTS